MLGGDSPYWIHYRWHVKTALEERQIPQSAAADLAGSFGDRDKWFSALGDVGTTAMSVQILSACYRCLPETHAPLAGIPRIALVTTNTASAGSR